jgi:hypothetical protein
MKKLYDIGRVFAYALLWFVAALLDTAFTLISFPLAPLVVLFTNSAGYLPAWLTWFQTFDNSLDAGWKIQGNFGDYLTTGIAPTGILLYWYRVRWLWRNPGYGFSYYVVGIAFDPTAWRVLAYSSDGANNTYLATDGRRFSLEIGRAWCSLKLGYKTWGYYNASAKTFNDIPWGPELRTMICATVRPW